VVVESNQLVPPISVYQIDWKGHKVAVKHILVADQNKELFARELKILSTCKHNDLVSDYLDLFPYNSFFLFSKGNLLGRELRVSPLSTHHGAYGRRESETTAARKSQGLAFSASQTLGILCAARRRLSS